MSRVVSSKKPVECMPVIAFSSEVSGSGRRPEIGPADRWTGTGHKTRPVHGPSAVATARSAVTES